MSSLMLFLEGIWSAFRHNISRVFSSKSGWLYKIDSFGEMQCLEVCGVVMGVPTIEGKLFPHVWPRGDLEYVVPDDDIRLRTEGITYFTRFFSLGMSDCYDEIEEILSHEFSGNWIFVQHRLSQEQVEFLLHPESVCA